MRIAAVLRRRGLPSFRPGRVRPRHSPHVQVSNRSRRGFPPAPGQRSGSICPEELKRGSSVDAKALVLVLFVGGRREVVVLQYRVEGSSRSILPLVALISTHVHISMSIHLYVNMCVYKHIHTHTHTSLVCMCMHLYVCLCMLDQMLQMFFTFAEQARSNTVTRMRRRTTSCLHLLQRSRGMRVRAPFVVLRTCLIARSCVSCRRWTELNSSAPRAYIPRHSARHGKQLRSPKAGAGVWNCRESCTRENENTRTLICSISRHPALHHTQSCHEAPCRYSGKLRRRKPTRRRSLNARTQSSGPKGTAGLLHMCVCVHIYIYIYTQK